MWVEYIPFLGSPEPGMQSMLFDDLNARARPFRGNKALLDHGKIRPYNHAAIECGDRLGDPQRFNEMLHAARRAATGNGETNAGCAKLICGSDGAGRQDLVLCDERAVNI